MKRTKNIHLERMRKGGVALCLSATLTGCGDKDGVVVANVDECVQMTKLSRAECATEYEKALQKSLDSNPQYFAQHSCEAEFKECEERHDGQWVPKMEGFLVEEDETSGTYSHHQPVIRYYRPFSSLHNSWMTPTGDVLGTATSKKVSAPSEVFASKPAAGRTVSRGGFGAVATARSRSSGGGFRGFGG